MHLLDRNVSSYKSVESVELAELLVWKGILSSVTVTRISPESEVGRGTYVCHLELLDAKSVAVPMSVIWSCWTQEQLHWEKVSESKDSVLESTRSGQIAYCHGVKTRLSTLGTGDVPRGSDSP